MRGPGDPISSSHHPGRDLSALLSASTAIRPCSFLFAGIKVIYFLTVTFLLLKQRQKTLEEIEAHFRQDTGRLVGYSLK